MTLNEAGRRFHIHMDELKYYEENGLLERQTLPDGTADYTEEELRKIGLIHALLKAGLDTETLKAYLQPLTNEASSKEEHIQILRRQRFKLLDDIHTKQQSLDQLDYMIGKIKKG